MFPKEEEWDSTCADMVEDDPTETKSKSKTTKVRQLVREKIRKMLEVVTELADNRAGQCEEGNFLKLLYAFNQEGIHFA